MSDQPAFDLFSRHFKADPFLTFARMRQEAPIYRHLMPNGKAVWYISRYDDVVAVLKDNDTFVKNYANAVPPEALPRSFHKPSLQKLINENMLFADPPEHTRLRALISQAFTPRRVESLRPRIREIADELLSVVEAAGRMDLIDNYAFPLPAIVIMELLGVPLSDRDRVREWSEVLISPSRVGIGFKERKRMLQAFVDYLQALFVQRQAEPQDDLISDLIQAEEAGERLTAVELSAMVALLLITGHETVVHLIGNGVLALLQHPEALERLKADPTLFPQATEELLRYDGPVETSTTRWACRDVPFGGRLIRRGDIVRVVLASANRDPAHFDQPDRLDLNRHPNRHLAFGQGIHYCLGAPLARLEGPIALQTLFDRLPDLRLAVPADQLHWQPGVIFRGLVRLPLEWAV